MLRSTMAKKDTAGFFLRPPRQLVNRLSELSDQFKKDSANQVAVEVLRDYLEFWVEAERARQEIIAMQQEKFIRIKTEMLRLPLHEATAEPVTKHQAQGKRSKK